MSKFITLSFIISFFTNLLWENAQAPLYVGYTSFWQHFSLCFLAAIIDGIIVTVVASASWFFRRKTQFGQLSILELLTLTFVGAVISTGIEKWALVYQYWHYTQAMPRLPIISVGIPPLLQLTILIPLTIYLARKILSHLTKGINYG